MDFPITMYFIEDYLPSKRHRKPSQREKTKQVTVTVPTVTELEAPVAYTVHTSETLKRLRWYRDCLWEPVSTSMYVEGVYTTSDMRAEKLPAECDAAANDARQYQREKTADERLQKFVAKHIVIDDTVYDKTSEPMYRVQYGTYVYLSVEHYYDRASSGITFNALEFDAAAAFIERANRGRKDAPPAVQKIIVHMPEQVRLNPLQDLRSYLRKDIAKYIKTTFPRIAALVPLSVYVQIESEVMSEKTILRRHYNDGDIVRAFENIIAQTFQIDIAPPAAENDEA